jgi:hypothetical protein
MAGCTEEEVAEDIGEGGGSGGDFFLIKEPRSRLNNYGNCLRPKYIKETASRLQNTNLHTTLNSI